MGSSVLVLIAKLVVQQFFFSHQMEKIPFFYTPKKQRGQCGGEKI